MRRPPAEIGPGMSEEIVDLVVVGAEPAGLAAAASAAARGMRVVIVRTGAERPTECAGPVISNDLWRRLGLYAEAAGVGRRRPRRTWFREAGKEPALLETSVDGLTASGSLGADELQALAAWPDFVRAVGRQTPSFGSLAALLGAEPVGLDPSPLACADAVLDDFFDSERLKAHLAVAALSPYQLAGDEPASAGGLRFIAADGFASAATAGEVGRLLESACDRLGVKGVSGSVARIERASGRLVRIGLVDGAEIVARRTMASSAALAAAVGLRAEAGVSPIAEPRWARAFVLATFADDPRTKYLREDATYVLVDGREGVRAARDAAAAGKLDANGPLLVDVSGRKIVAAAPFVPTRLDDGDEERDWTGQDRQALGRATLDRLKSTFRLTALPLNIEVRIERPSPRVEIPITAPPPSADEVVAAVQLAQSLFPDG